MAKYWCIEQATPFGPMFVRERWFGHELLPSTVGADRFPSETDAKRVLKTLPSVLGGKVTEHIDDSGAAP